MHSHQLAEEADVEMALRARARRRRGSHGLGPRARRLIGRETAQQVIGSFVVSSGSGVAAMSGEAAAGGAELVAGLRDAGRHGRFGLPAPCAWSY